MSKKTFIMFVGFAAVLACASLACAEVITRQNWVPAGNDANTGQPLGDLWTFHCPSGGSVTASVDTLNDNGSGGATLDPYMTIYGPTGTNLASQDDDMTCTVAPICGFQCPSVADVVCPSGGTYSLSVHFGSFGNGCGSGGYKLTIEVKNASGASQSAASVNLGGGASRSIPKWVDPNKSKKKAPALDDEGVPG